MAAKEIKAYRLTPRALELINETALRCGINNTDVVQACVECYAAQLPNERADALQKIWAILEACKEAAAGPPKLKLPPSLEKMAKLDADSVSLAKQILEQQQKPSPATPPPPATVSQPPKRRRGQ